MTLENLISRTGGRAKTATGYVTDVLREAIIAGVVEAGSPLRQEDVAARFGVSRAPVREALRLLEAQGLVEFVPHKGAVVASLDLEDVVEVFEARAALEAVALRRSIRELDAKAFDIASTLLDELDVETDLVRASELHRRFHLTLCSKASTRLLALIASQFDAADRYLRLELAELQNADESQDEHRELLAACRARDVETAVALLQPHIVEAGQALAQALAEVKARGGRS